MPNYTVYMQEFSLLHKSTQIITGYIHHSQIQQALLVRLYASVSFSLQHTTYFTDLAISKQLSWLPLRRSTVTQDFFTDTLIASSSPSHAFYLSSYILGKVCRWSRGFPRALHRNADQRCVSGIFLQYGVKHQSKSTYKYQTSLLQQDNCHSYNLSLGFSLQTYYFGHTDTVYIQK